MKVDKENMILSNEHINKLFGSTSAELKRFCGKIIEKENLSYKRIKGAELEAILLKILQELFSDNLKVSGKNRHTDWNLGWKENLDAFISSGYNEKELVPRYFRKNVPARLNGEFVFPSTPDFIYKLTRIFQTWLFRKYFSGYSNIYEFGCGTAHNLVFLLSLFPEKQMIGLDWSESSQKIIKLLKEKNKFNIRGHQFDFYKPDTNIRIEKNSAVLTFGALEQIGSQHKQFISFLLKNKPCIVINVECINEFYDENNLPDYMALQYHRKRNYLLNYYTALKQLENKNKVKIIKTHHQRFGNIYNDTHSYVVWKPS